MRIFEYKAYANAEQYAAIDEAIRATQFVRNKCIRLWMDARDTPYSVGRSEISRHTTELRADYPWAKKLNSTAVQAAGDRAWESISRFYKNLREGVKPVGYSRFPKTVRSVEYKHSGWRLRIPEAGEQIFPRITFKDGSGIGTLKLRGTWDTSLHPEELIRRVRIVRKSDGYYV
jgi:putative transposase